MSFKLLNTVDWNVVGSFPKYSVATQHVETMQLILHSLFFLTCPSRDLKLFFSFNFVRPATYNIMVTFISGILSQGVSLNEAKS